jgi:hypothetical protein
VPHLDVLLKIEGMKRFLFISAFIICVAGCVNNSNSNRRLITFYQQAVERSKSPESIKPIDLQGLTLSDGVLPGCPRFPSVDESSIIVSDRDPAESHAVQVIVAPRVSGSFLDPAEPTPEFLREQATDLEEAIKNHRYTAVYLLPKQKM